MTRAYHASLLPPAAGLGLAGLAWLGPGPAGAALLLAVLALVAGQIAWQDLATFTISDAAVAALSLLGVASRLAEGRLDGTPIVTTLGLAGLDGLLCGGAFLLVREGFYRWRGHDGLGLGDVKLALAAGILVGTEGFAWTVLAASLGGLCVAGAMQLRRAPSPEPRRIAFGALLAPTLCLVWLLAAGLPLMREPAAPSFAAGTR